MERHADAILRLILHENDMLEAGDALREDEKRFPRTGRANDGIHLMVIELRAVIDGSGAFINAQSHQVVMGEAFRCGFAAGDSGIRG